MVDVVRCLMHDAVTFKTMSYDILVPEETRVRLDAYEAEIQSGAVTPGRKLTASLAASSAIGGDFLTSLLRTKLPQIFAESAVAGDGSDWNLTELGLLGDISVDDARGNAEALLTMRDGMD